MQPSSPTWFPYLDGWRGLAIIAVLVGHFASISWLGPLGVQLFFALSGLLMGRLLFTKCVPLKAFFLRRGSRVIPTFLLFVGVMTLYARFFQPERYPASWAELAATLTFLRSYLPAAPPLGADDWAIGHLWSLNVEEHSYIYLALLALAARWSGSVRLTATLLCATTLLVLGLNFIYLSNPPAGPVAWFARSETAALGLIAAATLHFLRRRMAPRLLQTVPPLLPLLAIGAAIACFALYRHKGVQHTVAPLCLAFAVNYLDCLVAPVRAALSSAPLRWFGLCSFSLYLWQQPAYMAVLHYGLSRPAAVLLSLALGIFSFYAFENPVRVALNRQWAARGARSLEKAA